MRRQVRHIGPVEDHMRNAVKFAINYRGERRIIGRRYQFELVGKLSPLLSVQSSDAVYIVDSRDKVVSRATFEQCGFEAEFMDLAVTTLCQEQGISLRDKWFVDVGANIGITAIPALRRYHASHVVAIEPDEWNCRLLRANLAANGLQDRADVLECAVSSESGSLELELSPNNWGDHRIRVYAAQNGAFGEERWITRQVPVATLDSLELDPGKVSLIWLDVQGHEGHVLAGAERLLSAGVPLVAEFWPYGLRRSQGLDLFISIVERNFERAFVLRHSKKLRADEITVSIAHLKQLADTLGDSATTDLLLLPKPGRRPPDLSP